MTITFTVQQRLNLIGLLQQKCRGKRKDESRRLARDIFVKIRISDDELKLYQTNVPGVGVMQHMDAVKSADPIEADLTLTEIRRLDSIIAEFDNWGPADDDWL